MSNIEGCFHIGFRAQDTHGRHNVGPRKIGRTSIRNHGTIRGTLTFILEVLMKLLRSSKTLFAAKNVNKDSE